MKLSEKIQEALREQLEISLSDPAVQKRLAAHWGYVPAEAQPKKVHAVVCFYGHHYYVSALFFDPTSAIARCRKEINNSAYPDSWKVVEFEIEDTLDSVQPAPSEQDESVRKSWARFSHELHRSPDAPYPGMSDAFEQHFSQSLTDLEWRAEAATWAAAWKAAKRHCPQPTPSVPDGWLRAIDEALVTAHIGVANAHDTYEQAKAKLDNLIGFNVDIATDPAINGGWKLMPVEPTRNMLDAGEDTFVSSLSGTPTSSPIAVYHAMLEAAPEAKP